MRTAPALAAVLALAACGDPKAAPPTPLATPVTAPHTAILPAEARQKIASMIQKVMDTPRTVPAAGPRRAEVRGGPGNFAKLTVAQVDELVASIAFVADKFLPAKLKPEEKWAIIVADGSAETAFRMESMVPKDRPANDCAASPYHVIPGTWVPIFKQRAQLPDLKQYNGSPWVTGLTTCEQVRDSLWMGSVLAWWEISEQAKAGGANPRAAEFHEDGPGPMPKTIRSGILCHLLGYPEARKGPGSPGYEAQAPWYFSMQKTDLNLLGYDISLLDTPF